MPDDNLRRIEDCYVTASSGCHRYDYWNEQAIFDGRSDTGWCPPTRKSPQVEYLEIDLGRLCTPVTFRIQRRAASNAGTGFPPALRVLAYQDDGEEQAVLLDEKGISVAPGQWWEHELKPVATRRVRLEASNEELRPTETYVLQFTQLELFEKSSEVLPGDD
jgi:F5/8 type C domain-containing protein